MRGQLESRREREAAVSIHENELKALLKVKAMLAKVGDAVPAKDLAVLSS